MYTRSYTRCARFEAISTYNIAFTNALTHPFVYMRVFKRISYMVNNIHPTHMRQDKSRISTRLYTTIHITSDLKPPLFTTSRLQTRSHIHSSIYAYSNASHICSTMLIQPIRAKINRVLRRIYTLKIGEAETKALSSIVRGLIK